MRRKLAFACLPACAALLTRRAVAGTVLCMLTKSARSAITLARSVAQSSLSKHRHGAVLTRGGNVISTGFNKDRNDPRLCSPEHILQHCSTHAEASAIMQAGPAARGSVLYVVRVNKKSKLLNSRPCPRCWDAIRAAGVRKVVYSTDEGIAMSRTSDVSTSLALGRLDF